MYEQLLAHLVGDYLLQSEWMAQNKRDRWWPAIVHCLIYTLPFLLITTNPIALFIIFFTHVIIDHYALAKYWIAGKNVVMRPQLAPNEAIENRVDEFKELIKNFGFPQSAPGGIIAFVYITVDNTMHLVCNYLAIKYFG